jgi:hypothetical protein
MTVLAEISAVLLTLCVVASIISAFLLRDQHPDQGGNA